MSPARPVRLARILTTAIIALSVPSLLLGPDTEATHADDPNGWTPGGPGEGQNNGGNPADAGKGCLLAPSATDEPTTAGYGDLIPLDFKVEYYRARFENKGKVDYIDRDSPVKITYKIKNQGRGDGANPIDGAQRSDFSKAVATYPVNVTLIHTYNAYDGNPPEELLREQRVLNVPGAGASSATQAIFTDIEGEGRHDIILLVDSATGGTSGSFLKENCARHPPIATQAANQYIGETNNNDIKIIALAVKADLAVTSVEWVKARDSEDMVAFPVASTAAGCANFDHNCATHKFRATVTNVGGFEAFNNIDPSSTTLDLVKTAFTLDGSAGRCGGATNKIDFDLGTVGGAIQPGGTFIVETDCRMHGKKVPFVVAAETDTEKVLTEASTANNKNQTTETVKAADVVPSFFTDLSYQDDTLIVPEFGNFTFSVGIGNIGNARAVNWTVSGTTAAEHDFTYQLFMDNTANKLDERSSGLRLDPGQSESFPPYDYFTDPDNFPGGAHKLIIWADKNTDGADDDLVLESNEGNNVLEVPFIIAHFEIDATPSAATGKFAPGVDASIPFTVTNKGTVDEKLNGSISGVSWAATFLTKAFKPIHTLTLEPGATADLVVNVSVPKTASEGQKQNLTVRVFSEVPGSETDDVFNFNLEVGPDDVAPTITKLEPSGDFVGKSPIRFRVTDNVEVSKVEIDRGEGFRLSLPDEDTADQYSLSPTSFETDEFTVGVRATDAKGNVATRTFAFTKDTIDPVVQDVRVEDSSGKAATLVDPGDDLRVQVAASDRNMDTVVAQLSTPGFRTEFPLKLANTGFWSATFDAPNVPGTYTVIVIATDLAGNVGTDRNQEFSVRGMDIVAVNPDPVVTPKDPRAGETVQFTYILRNDGNRDAGPFKVTFFVDQKAVGNQTVNITKGLTKTVAFLWTAEPDPHSFVLRVDPGNELAETNEANQDFTSSTIKLFPGSETFRNPADAPPTLSELLSELWWVFVLLAVVVVVGVAVLVARRPSA